MNKTIVRELFIIVLLTIVIIITLRIVLFDFIPSKNSLPKPIEYSTDFSVEEVLDEIRLEQNNEEISKKESILKSYTIEESDLKNYVSKRNFGSGKTDPF